MCMCEGVYSQLVGEAASTCRPCGLHLPDITPLQVQESIKYYTTVVINLLRIILTFHYSHTKNYTTSS